MPPSDQTAGGRVGQRGGIDEQRDPLLGTIAGAAELRCAEAHGEGSRGSVVSVALSERRTSPPWIEAKPRICRTWALGANPRPVWTIGSPGV
jgi:hypothetical protein